MVRHCQRGLELKTHDMARALTRIIGLLWLASGLLQIPIGVALMIGAVASGQSALAALPAQMALYGVPAVAMGVVVLAFSGAIARFAAKGSSDA